MEKDRLKENTILRDRYRIKKVLGAGGFGITYLAEDVSLGQSVVVKEYFPQEIAGRARDLERQAVRPREKNDRKRFLKGKRDFLTEARRMSELFTVPETVKVLDWFEENETAYLVMEFVRGISLERYLERLDMPPTFLEAWGMIEPVARALSKVHGKGLIHRDLNPSNLMIQEDGSVKIIDFGAARKYLENDKTMTVLVKHGYAPPEQYLDRGKQGPWTDVYSLCATLYEMITGVRPEPSVDRMQKDTLYLPSVYGAEIRPDEERELRRGLELDPKKRIRTMEELCRAFRPENVSEVNEKASSEKKRRLQSPARLCCGAAVCLGIAAAVFLPHSGTGREKISYAGNYGRGTEKYQEFSAFVQEHAVSKTVQEREGNGIPEESVIYTLTPEAVRLWGEPCNMMRFEKKREELTVWMDGLENRPEQTESRETAQVEMRKYGAVLTQFVHTEQYESEKGFTLSVYSDSVNGDLLGFFVTWEEERRQDAEDFIAELLGFLESGQRAGVADVREKIRGLMESPGEGAETEGASYRVCVVQTEGGSGLFIVPNEEAAGSREYYWP